MGDVSIDKLKSANLYLSNQVEMFGALLEAKDKEIETLKTLIEMLQKGNADKIANHAVLEQISGNTIESMNKKFASERAEMVGEINKLKAQLAKYEE